MTISPWGKTVCHCRSLGRGKCQERWGGFPLLGSLLGQVGILLLCSFCYSDPRALGYQGSQCPRLQCGVGLGSSNTHKAIASTPSVEGKCSMDGDFSHLVWLCGAVPAYSHTGRRQEPSSCPWWPPRVSLTPCLVSAP